MELIYAAEARKELLEATSYYEEREAGLGRAFLMEAEKTVERLTRHPTRQHIIRGRFRRCPFERFPYGVVYAVEGESIFVVAFMHLKRRPDYW